MWIEARQAKAAVRAEKEMEKEKEKEATAAAAAATAAAAEGGDARPAQLPIKVKKELPSREEALALLPHPSRYERGLSQWEINNYLGYIIRYPGKVGMIGQHWERHPQRSSDKLLCTVIRVVTS